MSGGHFDYSQYHINEIADELERIINTPKGVQHTYDENGQFQQYDYSPETLEQFKKGMLMLRIAYCYAQRADWLISGDDGEEAFHKRLKEDVNVVLNEYEEKYVNAGTT